MNTVAVPGISHPLALARRLRNSSLRWQILSLLLVVFVPMSLLIGVGVYRFIATNEKATWQARQQEVATYAGIVVHDFIVRLQDYLLLAGSFDRAVLAQDPDLLDDYLAQNPAVLELIRTDENGQLLGSAHREQALLSDMFTLPQAQWFTEARAGHPHFGGFQVSSRDEPYLIASVPSGDGGVVAARVRLDILWDVVKQIQFGKTGSAYVITRAGDIIAHQDPQVVLAFTSLHHHPELKNVATDLSSWSGVYSNFNGETVQSVSRAIPDTDWIVVAEILISEAEATSRIALALFIVGITILGIAMMAFTYHSLHKLVLSPLQEMRIGAVRISAGDHDYRIQLGQRDEIGQLADAFDNMVNQLQIRNTELSLKTSELATEVEEHRATQAQLRQLNDTLEQRIVQRTHELEVLNAELTRSNRELQEFAYVASHDLQEPLRKIRAFGDRLVERYAGILDERGKDYITRMQGSAARMQTLIDALLTYSRVTSKAQPFAPTDLNQIVHDVIADLDLRLQEVMGKVTVHQLATVDADAIQMRLLFQNLISNALKFHAPDTPPLVVIEGSWVRERAGNGAGPPGDTGFRFTVSDNGIGFEPEYAERIFQVFQRLHGRSEYEGTGVGLAICRKIVDRHGGTIVATSTAGQGACFTVTLPANRCMSGPE